MPQRPQIIQLIDAAETAIDLRILAPFRLRRHHARDGGFETPGQERVLEDAVADDGDERAEAGDAGADDGDVGLEGGPDAEVDGSPCV